MKAPKEDDLSVVPLSIYVAPIESGSFGAFCRQDYEVILRLSRVTFDRSHTQGTMRLTNFVLCGTKGKHNGVKR